MGHLRVYNNPIVCIDVNSGFKSKHYIQLYPSFAWKQLYSVMFLKCMSIDDYMERYTIIFVKEQKDVYNIL